jgi:adenylate cyclase class 2
METGDRMPIEIEKKYRLTETQRYEVERRLPEIGAIFESQEFEENTLYSGEMLNAGTSVLRLRRILDGAESTNVAQHAILTFKLRFPSSSAIKQQQEDETQVSDGDAMEAILEALSFVPALVYEKRRATWRLGEAEIVIDELPFGLFMEIEGPATEIRKLERRLAIKGLKAEHATYPQLTERHGETSGSVIEARFPNTKPRLIASPRKTKRKAALLVKERGKR